MLFKFIVLVFLAIILYSLGSALYFLVREKNKQDATAVAKALTWRIGLSLFVFVLLFIAMTLGWISPHNV